MNDEPLDPFTQTGENTSRKPTTSTAEAVQNVAITLILCATLVAIIWLFSR